MATKKQITEALDKVMIPGAMKSVVALDLVKEITVSNGKVHVKVASTGLSGIEQSWVKGKGEENIKALPGVTEATIDLVEIKASDVNEIDHVIAVMSGKGGVGKSLVTGLLATALKRTGYNVGILDADITGASVPKLFGIHGPLMAKNNKIQPIQSRTGIKIVSVNLALENESTAFVWRGSMITKAIQDFWNDTEWGALDFLLIDMPPGTSDAALTVMQEMSVHEIVMVTSPQSLATMIVKKALDMAQKMNATIVGVIENMAGFTAPDTGTHYEIFGPSHAMEVAEAAGAPLLARLPIDPQVAERCDAGEIEMLSTEALNACVEALAQKQAEQ